MSILYTGIFELNSTSSSADDEYKKSDVKHRKIQINYCLPQYSLLKYSLFINNRMVQLPKALVILDTAVFPHSDCQSQFCVCSTFNFSVHFTIANLISH